MSCVVAGEARDSAEPADVDAVLVTPAGDPEPLRVPSQDVLSCVHVSIPQHTASIGASIAILIVGAVNGGYGFNGHGQWTRSKRKPLQPLGLALCVGGLAVW